MWMVLARAVIAGVVVAVVPMLARKSPRLGALILTLPIVSILAILFTWMKEQDVPAVARFCRETLVLVPLGLPFFVPLALAERWGLGFWPAFVLGVVLAAGCIGLWFHFGPKLG